MQRVGLLAFLAVFLLCTAPAWADNASTLATIREHLKKADPQPIRKLLTPAVCEALAKEPKDAAQACAYAVIYARDATEDTSDPEDMVPILEAFLHIGQRSVELHPEVVDAYIALARARRALCRHRLAEDGVVRPDEWQAVADAWFAASRCPKGQIHTVDAFLTLLEGAAAGTKQRVALQDRAEKLGRDLLAQNAKHPQASVGLAEVRFAQARRSFGAGDKQAAAAAAAEVRSLVEEHTGSSSPVCHRARSLVNRTARFLRSTKIDRKAEFLAREKKTRWGYLAFDMPWGSHWSVEHSKRKNVQTMTTLKRTEELTSPGRTYITFKRYKWSVEYTSEDGDAGGDNPRGLLEQDRKDDIEWLAEVGRQKKLIRGKLNRAIKRTSGYELRGTDADLDRWWIRTWYFKSKDRPRTFCVRVSRYGREDPGTDPEIQHILDSIREVPEEK